MPLERPSAPSTLDQAEERLRRAANDPSALIAAAHASAESFPAVAAKALRKAIQIEPGSADAYRGLAALYSSDRYLDREIQTLEALLKIAPNDAPAIARLSTLYLRIHDIARADALLRKALAANPENHALVEARIAFAYSARKTEEGRSLLEKLISEIPSDSMLRNRLSEMQRAEGRFDEAEKTIRAAIDQKPDEPLHHRQLAHILVTSERPERLPDAEAAARRAAEALPGDAESLYWLALALDRQDKSAEAIDYFERVSRLDIQFEKTAFRLGRLYQSAGRLAEGERLLKLYNEMERNRSTLAQAIGLLKNHPERVENHLSLARIYRRAGELGVAAALLRRAASRFPSKAGVQTLLAETLKDAGRDTEAKAVAALSRRSAG